MSVLPPFAYYGGKTTLADTIANLLPAHEHYVEPFAGSLAVLLAKRPSRQETVNDLDRDLVTFWRVLREHPHELERAALLTPHARAEFELSKELDLPDDLERARRVWVRLTQSRSQSMKSTGWKFTRNALGRTIDVHPFAERIGACAERIAGVSLECRDALEVIRDYGAEPTVCMYVDPPYLGSTRATNYRHELTTDQEHQDLADALNAAQSSIVVSGYHSPLYEQLFAGWHHRELKGPTTISGASDRVEVLWSNRELDAGGLW